MSGALLAEAQARLNVSLKEIVAFFEDQGIKEHSVDLLNNFIDKHLTVDFLSLSENFGKCMAFNDHDELNSKLFKSFTLLIEGYVIERKVTNKRLKMLKEDKKSDPDVILRLENLLIDIDQRKAIATASLARLRAMQTISINKFKDPNFDYKKAYKESVLAHRQQKLKK